MIVGTGNVGASIGFALVNQRTAVNELILTDINQPDAEGEAMDLQDALAVAPSYMRIKAGDYRDATDCDVVIITAGAPQKDGETRLDLLKKNASIFQGIVRPIMNSGFSGLFLVVSNPMDVLTYLTWKYSGLPPERVIGSGDVLDSARLRFRIAERLGVHPKSIHAHMIGEHGDSELALWSNATMGGQKLTELISAEGRETIERSVRDKAYQIIQKKGATYYGIGACVAQILSCILGDERRILSVSSYDECTDVYNSFPAVLGREGIIRRLSLPMNESEGIKFQQSVNTLKNAIQELQNS